MNSDTSAYFSMNKLGSYVLAEILAADRSPDDIARLLEDRYGDTASEVRADIQLLLDHLMREGLVVTVENPSDIQPVEGDTSVDLPAAYEKPTLERHGELEQLILSGE